MENKTPRESKKNSVRFSDAAPSTAPPKKSIRFSKPNASPNSTVKPPTSILRNSVRVSWPVLQPTPRQSKRESGALPEPEESYPTELTILGVQRIFSPKKNYVFIIMMLWSDNSELIIYRTLKQIRQLIKRMEQVVPTSALLDLKEPSMLLRKRYIWGDTRLAVHVKQLDNLIKLFAVLEFHTSILDDSECQDFFIRSKDSKAKNLNDLEATSFLIINHDKLEATRFLEKYRTNRRKFMSNIHGAVQRITADKFIAISNFSPTNKGELEVSKRDLINVVTREETGWWFAENKKTGKSGWVPADYLRAIEAQDDVQADRVSNFDFGMENCAFEDDDHTEFITTQKYKAKKPKEVSFEKHCIVTLIEKMEHGWWKVHYNNKEGLAPACFLEPYIEPMKEIGQGMVTNQAKGRLSDGTALKSRNSVRISWPVNTRHSTLTNLYPTQLTILGIRRLAIPEKRYVYMIMMLWSDKSELIIYRTLEQIRQLLKRMELVAPTDAKHDLAESSQLINKKRLLGDMRLSVHVKHLAHLMKLFAVLEFHGSILHDSVCQNFFMKNKELDVTAGEGETTSFLVVDHDKLEADSFLQKHRNNRRKFMSNIHGVTIITEDKHIVISNFKSKNKDELAVTKGHVVNVITKEKTGWWFVENKKTQKSGWVPADYLHPIHMTKTIEEGDSDDFTERKDINPIDSKQVEFITVKPYKAKKAKEVSFDANCMVTLLEKKGNGWWRVRYNDREGLAPASYLEPYTDLMKTIGANVKANTT